MTTERSPDVVAWARVPRPRGRGDRKFGVTYDPSDPIAKGIALVVIGRIRSRLGARESMKGIPKAMPKAATDYTVLNDGFGRLDSGPTKHMAFRWAVVPVTLAATGIATNNHNVLG